jgi:hypothetical protein
VGDDRLDIEGAQRQQSGSTVGSGAVRQQGRVEEGRAEVGGARLKESSSGTV